MRCYPASWNQGADLLGISLFLEVFLGVLLFLKQFRNIRNILTCGTIVGTGFSCLISLHRLSFFLMTSSEKCLAQTKICWNSCTSLRFTNLSQRFLCCSSSGSSKTVSFSWPAWFETHPGTQHLLTILIPSW